MKVLLSLAALVVGALGYVAVGSKALPTPSNTNSAEPGAAQPTGINFQEIGTVIRGQASVVDGDTLDVHGQRIRLSGVDAPESGQKCADADGKLWRCGAAAANALQRYIGSATVSCRVDDTDRYGRAVSTCMVGDKDVQEWLARNGYAVAYRQYSNYYVDEEEAAEAARAGVWAGDFVNPADWRKGLRLPGEPPTKAMREGKIGPRS